jgi:hypothetical protein
VIADGYCLTVIFAADEALPNQLSRRQCMPKQSRLIVGFECFREGPVANGAIRLETTNLAETSANSAQSKLSLMGKVRLC